MKRDILVAKKTIYATRDWKTAYEADGEANYLRRVREYLKAKSDGKKSNEEKLDEKKLYGKKPDEEKPDEEKPDGKKLYGKKLYGKKSNEEKPDGKNVVVHMTRKRKAIIEDERKFENRRRTRSQKVVY